MFFFVPHLISYDILKPLVIQKEKRVASDACQAKEPGRELKLSKAEVPFSFFLQTSGQSLRHFAQAVQQALSFAFSLTLSRLLEKYSSQCTSELKHEPMILTVVSAACKKTSVVLLLSKIISDVGESFAFSFFGQHGDKLS